MDDRSTLSAFEGLAASYAKHRPTYPLAIFEAALEGLPVPPRVADVGCGTGISSRLLASLGARVVGVDPSLDMLSQARQASPESIEWRRGTAEATGLPDASVDLVVAAQAFHWFDPQRALAEFHRILRPGGRVALVWNLRQKDGGFTDAYERIVVGERERLDPSTRAAREDLDAALVASPRFHLLEVARADSPQVLDEEGIIGRATSASYFPRHEPVRSERLAELRAAFARHAKDGVVTLSQEARATIAVKV